MTHLTDQQLATKNCEELFQQFQTSDKGLSEEEAEKRFEEYGPNEPAKKKKRTISKMSNCFRNVNAS